ncbi:uncharacterized protein LY79DRAFT_278554 [Colletotrichum navitas]|uniref:Transmembrane protein n=1 Tax=Colletotrichum navitas TaxID=681940 RepID=A0AAD8PUY4_9PEZI|nr:uncharacterized protein LY79DRAFT_278554 [Colletotrichum navitas]KAK1585086.1 hypothetical protein LY79DRAFT_278554 [Colletotrichum navitas]
MGKRRVLSHTRNRQRAAHAVTQMQHIRLHNDYASHRPTLLELLPHLRCPCLSRRAPAGVRRTGDPIPSAPARAPRRNTNSRGNKQTLKSGPLERQWRSHTGSSKGGRCVGTSSVPSEPFGQGKEKSHGTRASGKDANPAVAVLANNGQPPTEAKKPSGLGLLLPLAVFFFLFLGLVGVGFPSTSRARACESKNEVAYDRETGKRE